MFCFDPLADIAILDEHCNLALHAVPPEILLQILVHLGSTGVDRIQSLVGFLHNQLLELRIRRDAETSLVPEDTFRINGESKDFFLIQPSLDAFDTLVALLCFLDLIP